MFTKEQQSVLEKNKWYIIGGMQARIDDLSRSIESSEMTLASDRAKEILDGPDGFAKDPYVSLQNMIGHAEGIRREYQTALDELKAVGIGR